MYLGIYVEVKKFILFIVIIQGFRYERERKKERKKDRGDKKTRAENWGGEKNVFRLLMLLGKEFFLVVCLGDHQVSRDRGDK